MKIDPSAYSALSAGLKLTYAQLDALTDDEWLQILEKFKWVEACIVDDKVAWFPTAAGTKRGKIDELPLISQRILPGGGLLPTAVPTVIPTVSDGETPSELLVTEIKQAVTEANAPDTVWHDHNTMFDALEQEAKQEETFHDHYQPKDRVPLPGGIESLAIDYQPNSGKPAETVTVVEQKTKTKRPYNKSKKV